MIAKTTKLFLVLYFNKSSKKQSIPSFVVIIIYYFLPLSFRSEILFRLFHEFHHAFIFLQKLTCWKRLVLFDKPRMSELSIFSTNFFPEPPQKTEVSFYSKKPCLKDGKKGNLVSAPYFLEHLDGLQAGAYQNILTQVAIHHSKIYPSYYLQWPLLSFQDLKALIANWQLCNRNAHKNFNEPGSKESKELAS